MGCFAIGRRLFRWRKLLLGRIWGPFQEGGRWFSSGQVGSAEIPKTALGCRDLFAWARFGLVPDWRCASNALLNAFYGSLKVPEHERVQES